MQGFSNLGSCNTNNNMELVIEGYVRTVGVYITRGLYSDMV